METDRDRQISTLQAEMAGITAKLEQARRIVQEWTEASSTLSLNAAKARADNRSAGRGIGGILLGSKYRASVRRSAASSNAKIAKEVADRRAKIAEGKQTALG